MRTSGILSVGAALLLANGFVHAQPAVPSVTRWPGDRQAAIALTFDDALASHLDQAGPILKRHGLHGTFFVTTGKGIWRDRAADWQRLADEGNEIGGHTVTHPCLLERIQPHSQALTAPQMEAEIANGAQAILDGTPTRRGLTFAYPCGNIGFGPPADQTRDAALYVSYVALHFFAARTYGTAGTVDPDSLSILNVPDLGPTAGRDYPGLLDMMQPALNKHDAGVFTFHGIGGDYLAVSGEALDELASYLGRHPEIWIATFGDLIRYIQESKALLVQPAGLADGTAEFRLRWRLDTAIFDLPLTLKWKLPANWASLRAEADGRELHARITAAPDGPVAMLEVASRTRSLRFQRVER